MVSFFCVLAPEGMNVIAFGEGRGGKSENSCLLERYIVQKIIFSYNDKFIMYSDSMRYHLIISET